MGELAALAAPPGTRAAAPVDPDTIGMPSEAALEAVERLVREAASGPDESGRGPAGP